MKEENRGKSLLKLLLIVAATAAFCVMGYLNMPNIKLGLDLAGGVSITYQATEENPSKQDMDDTIYKLQKRAEGYSSEAEVYQEGANRINIDIPGVSDANAILEELGKPGSLQFVEGSYDADGNLTGFDNVVLDGTAVKQAQVGMVEGRNGASDSYEVGITFTDEGAKTFAEVTGRNIGKQIAIVYDNEIVSAPRVNDAITGGQCSITGDFTLEEAQSLASTIRLGALKLELTELRSNVVGAKLGQQAISTSLLAGAIGFAIVVVFMIAVYRVAGVAASIALSLYVGLILILLDAFEVTLTLPGIAGIVLSIGMAVDANVIIFTRIKEELGIGKSVREALDAGFHKALSAIIDGNVTTIIAAAVLYFRGSGTVKGFAQTLALGIILSMMTALFVTRWLLHAFYGMGLDKPSMYGIKKPVEKPVDFIGKRKLCYTVSALVIACGIAFMGINKASIGDMFNYGLDFKGGTSTNVTFNEDMSLEDISAKVVPVVTEVTGDQAPQTQKVQGTNEVIIKTGSLSAEQREALNQRLADEFGVDQEKITAENISGAVSGEMKRDAVAATAIATVLMLLYIWFRFKDIRFASSAVLALCHDVMVVVTCYAVLKWAVGSTFIACILTIVGYSINATIVIFDRIRENLKIYGNTDLKMIVNRSITETLTRSLNTSLTTFVMVLCLYIIGVSSIREFALPLMVGIVAGAYSSVCVTGPLWYDLTSRNMKKVGEKRAAELEADRLAKSSKKKAKASRSKEVK
ncbi:MAG: protein translocase subunit SecD [Eubacteriales bacterium]|nr:protein translocase subunit SecD [Eubacteriales bacterium]